MTNHEKISLLKLQTFTPTDFEQYRAGSEGVRHSLSAAVIACLFLPKGWVVGCEFHQEWGGMYPVHLRLAIQSAPTIKIEIISPSHDSPYWYGRLWFEAGESVAWFYSGDVFEPDAIRASLGVLDEYIDAGYNDADALAVALRMGGHVV